MEFKKLENRVNSKGSIEVEIELAPECVHELLVDFYSTIATYKGLAANSSFDEIEEAAKGAFPPDYFREVKRDFVVNRAVGEALERLEIKPALTPKIHALEYPADGEGYGFGVSVVERPALSLSSYEPVEIEADLVVVDDEMVKDKVSQILDGFADFVEAEARPVRRGDYLEVDIATQVNGGLSGELSGSHTIYCVTEGKMPTAFVDGMVGMTPGETKVISYDLPRLRGISEDDVDHYVVTVTVHGQRAKVEPELDDAFVRRNFPKVSTVEEFLSELRKDLEYDAMVFNKDTIVHLGNSVLEKRLEGYIPDEFYQASYTSQMNKLQHDLKKQGKTLQDYYDENEVNEEELSVQMLVKAGENLRQGFALEALFDGLDMRFEQGDLEEAGKRLLGLETVSEDSLKRLGKLHLVESAAKRMRSIAWLANTAVVRPLTKEVA